MHAVIAKTFGGLSAPYYFRHFIFGLVFPVLIYAALSRANQALQVSTMIVLVVNTLLYPYSRYVYESVTSFIVGDNIFFVDALLMIAAKVTMRAFCWVFAILAAPIGLAYLYFHHSKASH